MQLLEIPADTWEEENRKSRTDFFIEYKEGPMPCKLEHYHESYELDFFVQANIQVFIKNITYEINNGDILLVNPFDIHRILYSENIYRRYVLYFKKSFVADLLKIFNIEDFWEVVEQAENRRATTDLTERVALQDLFHTLLVHYHLYQCHPEDNMTLAALKMTLLLVLFRYRALVLSTDTCNKLTKKEYHVKEIITYIDQNYQYALSLTSLAKQFYMNEYYISHIFKEITHFPVTAYINYRRIIEAQKMLKDSSKSIMEICHDCGFNNLQYFHKMFKKILKTTPYKYRKMVKTSSL
jgi:AraC-like DNA-binding protein